MEWLIKFFMMLKLIFKIYIFYFIFTEYVQYKIYNVKYKIIYVNNNINETISGKLMCRACHLATIGAASGPGHSPAPHLSPASYQYMG